MFLGVWRRQLRVRGDPFQARAIPASRRRFHSSGTHRERLQGAGTSQGAEGTPVRARTPRQRGPSQSLERVRARCRRTRTSSDHVAEVRRNTPGRHPDEHEPDARKASSRTLHLQAAPNEIGPRGAKASIWKCGDQWSLMNRLHSACSGVGTSSSDGRPAFAAIGDDDGMNTANQRPRSAWAQRCSTDSKAGRQACASGRATRNRAWWGQATRPNARRHPTPRPTPCRKRRPGGTPQCTRIA